jgi:hypothetical protein
MAEDVLTASTQKVGILINNAVLHLAGEGGKAPGAGGGGGGAVGPNSRAGHGGSGGHLWQANGADVQPSDANPDFEDDFDGAPPGAGGGGGGAVGPGAIAGDGGDGGDCVIGAFDVEPGDQLEIFVGAGGKAAVLPGQHAGSGEHSWVRLRSPDGLIKQFLLVAGGKGALSGKIPDGYSTISQDDLDSGFTISTLMLANSLDIRENLIFMLGGGWSKYTVPHMPIDVVWPVVCNANWTKELSQQTRGLQLCLSNPHGDEVSRLLLELPTALQAGNNCTWIQGLGAPLNQVGIWRVTVQSGAFLLAEVSVRVEVASP